jgi:hypothetical protein
MGGAVTDASQDLERLIEVIEVGGSTQDTVALLEKM